MENRDFKQMLILYIYGKDFFAAILNHKCQQAILGT